jgi:hypothetical protein
MIKKYGKSGMGKIVVLDPTQLQNEVSGNYFCQSKYDYTNFRNNLYRYGFMWGTYRSKIGKPYGPCWYVHDSLGSELESLIGIKYTRL